MAEAVVIDLGEDWALPHDAPPPAGHWQGRWRGWLRRGAMAVTPLLILILGGSAVAQPVLRQVRTLPAIGGDAFELAGDRIFVLAHGRGSSGGTVTAFPLPQGAPRWTATLAEPRVDAIQLVPSAGVLLAWSYSDQTGSRVTALDQNTGRTLWRMADAPAGDLRLETGQMLLVTSGPEGLTGVRMIDLRSGRPVWSRSPPPGANLSVVQTPAGGTSTGRIVLQLPDGAAQVLDEDSGKILATGKLPAPPPIQRSSGPSQASVSAIGDQVLFTDVRLNDTVVTAYGLSDMTRRWQVTVPVRAFGVGPCGPVLCVQGDTGTAAVDPSSGAIRWQADWAGAWPLGPWLAAITNDNRGERAALIRPRDGQTLLDLGRWRVPWMPRPGGPMLMVADQPGRLGAWLGVLDTPGLAIRPLGWLPEAVRDQCRFGSATSTYLACGTVHGYTRVWQYRARPE
jgi:hypothetical protein